MRVGCFQFVLGPTNSKTLMVQTLPLSSPWTSPNPGSTSRGWGLSGMVLGPSLCDSYLQDYILNFHTCQSDIPFATLASMVLNCLGPHSSPHFHEPWKHFAPPLLLPRSPASCSISSSDSQAISWAGALPILESVQEPPGCALLLLLGRNPCSPITLGMTEACVVTLEFNGKG